MSSAAPLYQPLPKPKVRLLPSPIETGPRPFPETLTLPPAANTNVEIEIVETFARKFLRVGFKVASTVARWGNVAAVVLECESDNPQRPTHTPIIDQPPHAAPIAQWLSELEEAARIATQIATLTAQIHLLEDRGLSHLTQHLQLQLDALTAQVATISATNPILGHAIRAQASSTRGSAATFSSSRDEHWLEEQAEAGLFYMHEGRVLLAAMGRTRLQNVITATQNHSKTVSANLLTDLITAFRLTPPEYHHGNAQWLHNKLIKLFEHLGPAAAEVAPIMLEGSVDMASRYFEAFAALGPSVTQYVPQLLDISLRPNDEGRYAFGYFNTLVRHHVPIRDTLLGILRHSPDNEERLMRQIAAVRVISNFTFSAARRESIDPEVGEFVHDLVALLPNLHPDVQVEFMRDPPIIRDEGDRRTVVDWTLQTAQLTISSGIYDIAVSALRRIDTSSLQTLSELLADRLKTATTDHQRLPLVLALSELQTNNTNISADLSPFIPIVATILVRARNIELQDAAAQLIYEWIGLQQDKDIPVSSRIGVLLSALGVAHQIAQHQKPRKSVDAGIAEFARILRISQKDVAKIVAGIASMDSVIYPDILRRCTDKEVKSHLLEALETMVFNGQQNADKALRRLQRSAPEID